METELPAVLEHMNLCQKVFVITFLLSYCWRLLRSFNKFHINLHTVTVIIWYWLNVYTRENLWEQQRKICKNLLIAGKGARILQCKVFLTSVKSDYLCQKALNLSILVEKMKKNSGLVLIIIQEQCGKELSTGKQDRGMFPHYLCFSEISSKMTETTRV